MACCCKQPYWPIKWNILCPLIMLVLDFFCCYVNFPEASVSIREVLFYRKGPQGLVLHVTPDRIHQVISSSMQRPWRSQVYFMCDFAEEQILTLQYNKMYHHKRKLGNNQNSSQNPTFYILSWSFYSIGVTLYSSLVDFIKNQILNLVFFFMSLSYSSSFYDV